ncbi:MAG: hypothetical protein R2794_04650 [Chitinophagales bacterium]
MSACITFFFEQAGWLLIIPVILSIRWFRAFSRPFKWISLYVYLLFTTHVISYFLWQRGQNNMVVAHVFSFFEFHILLYFFYLLLRPAFTALACLCTALGFSGFFLADTFIWEGLYNLQTYSITLESVVFVFFSVWWFIHIVRDYKVPLSGLTDLRYVVIGILLYFAGSVLLFALNDYVNKITRSLRINVWSIHTLLALILYGMICIGMWRRYTKWIHT